MKLYEVTFTCRDSDGLTIGSGKAYVPATDGMAAVQHLVKICQADSNQAKAEPLILTDAETTLRDLTARDLVVKLIVSDIEVDNRIQKNPEDQRMAFALLDSENYHHAKYAQTAINIANAMIRSRRAS